MEYVIRPWGSYQVLYNNDNHGYQVKKLTIHPGQRTSLQYHLKRSEHWTVVHGTPLLQVGDDELVLQRNQSLFIPTGVKHRITNRTNEMIEIIECQIGECSECDIVRVEDDYQR